MSMYNDPRFVEFLEQRGYSTHGLKIRLDDSSPKMPLLTDMLQIQNTALSLPLEEQLIADFMPLTPPPTSSSQNINLPQQPNSSPPWWPVSTFNSPYLDALLFDRLPGEALDSGALNPSLTEGLTGASNASQWPEYGQGFALLRSQHIDSTVETVNANQIESSQMRDNANRRSTRSTPSQEDPVDSASTPAQLAIERPFACGICIWRFQRRRDRDRHERSVHTRESRYWCTGCKKGFVRTDARQRHWKKSPECQEKHRNSE